MESLIAVEIAAGQYIWRVVKPNNVVIDQSAGTFASAALALANGQLYFEGE